MQKKMVVAFLGPKGTFTWEAAKTRFPDDELSEGSSWKEVFRQVESDSADFGILPVENNTTGIIAETLHMLLEQPQDTLIRVCDEVYLRINHNLLATTDEVRLSEIRRLYVHRQPRMQCSNWLDHNLKDVQVIDASTTAESAELLLKDGESNKAACIGSKLLAEEKGLKIIVPDIEDYSNNITRFFIFGKVEEERIGLDSERYKTTIAMILLNRVGTLRKTLEKIDSNEINLTSIKTVPVRYAPVFDWEDWLVVDLEVREDEERFKKMWLDMQEAKPYILGVKILGTYPDRKEEKPKPAKTKIIKPIVSASIEFPGVKRLIVEGESAFIEFKSSLRWDIKNKCESKEIQRTIAKVVAGFMNTSGGTLIIGVDDNGTIVGLEADFKTLKDKPNKDGFQLALMQLISNVIGKAYCKFLRPKFEEVANRVICIVQIDKSPRPVYLTYEDKPEFYVRVGNSTRPLNVKEATDYIAMNWPK